MTRRDFIDELKQALTGEVPANVMLESCSYYDNYIEDEMRKGRSEEEVLEELGKPMLIARSIIAAQTGERDVDYEYTEDGRTRTVYNHSSRNQDKKKGSQSVNGTENNNSSSNNKNSQFVFNFSGILAKVVLVLFFMLLIIIAFFMIKIGFWVLVTFGIPILLILGIIYLIMYFVGGSN